MHEKLAANFAAPFLARCRFHRLPQQRAGVTRRHEKADEHRVFIRRHVDADDPPTFVDRRTTAHAGIERAGEQNLLVNPRFHQTVVNAFGDEKAEFERMPQRKNTLTLHESGIAQAEDRPRRSCGIGLGAQHGQIMDHIHRDERGLDGALTGVAELDPKFVGVDGQG